MVVILVGDRLKRLTVNAFVMDIFTDFILDCDSAVLMGVVSMHAGLSSPKAPCPERVSVVYHDPRDNGPVMSLLPSVLSPVDLVEVRTPEVVENDLVTPSRVASVSSGSPCVLIWQRCGRYWR